MMNQQIFTLLIAIVCITLVHGATKLKKKDKKPKLLSRQGLEASVESIEGNPPVASFQESATQYPIENGGDQKLDFNVYNNDNNVPYRDQYLDPDLNQYQNQDQNQYQNQEQYDGDNLAHINQMEQQFEDEDEDGFFLDMESGEFDSKEMIMLHGKGTRAIEAGDIFTAQEMLPIAEKLMNRAASTGKGRGIVTSATNPKSLADNLFEKYFFKMKRIVILKDEDISGLDALQALSLSGTVNTQRSREKYLGSGIGLKKHGAKAVPDTKEIAPRRKSRYRLLTKPFYNKVRRVPRRRENYLTRDGRKARMGRKRKLIVNPKRRRLTKNIKYRKGRGGQLKKTNRNKIGRQGQNPIKKRRTPNKMDGGSKRKRFCRWKYGCKHQLVLETCRLSMDCSEDARSKDYLGINLLPHEKRENLEMLRSWAGVDVIDTEVEKILENRYHQQIYSKLGNIQRSESVADYFNNLINFQKHEHVNNGEGPTTPMYSDEDSANPDAQQSDEEDPGAQSNGFSGEDAQQNAQEDPGAQPNGFSGEDAQQNAQEDPGAQPNGFSGEGPETDVVQLNAELVEPGEGQEVAEEAAEPGIIEDAAEPGIVAGAAEPGIIEEAAEPGIVVKAVEPDIAAEAAMVAEEGTIEPEHIQEEIAATELADTENRRKFLSDHKTTTENLKKIKL